VPPVERRDASGAGFLTLSRRGGGTGDCLFMNKPAQALLENQIDFDLVPADVFARPEKFNASFDGLLHINGETYRAMVVPYAEFLTRATAVFAVKAQQAGFLVLFIQGLPSGISDEADHAVSGGLFNELKPCRVVLLADLAATLERALADMPNPFGPPAGAPPSPTGIIGPAEIFFS
jgi:hypothetical protein